MRSVCDAALRCGIVFCRSPRRFRVFRGARSHLRSPLPPGESRCEGSCTSTAAAQRGSMSTAREHACDLPRDIGPRKRGRNPPCSPAGPILARDDNHDFACPRFEALPWSAAAEHKFADLTLPARVDGEHSSRRMAARGSRCRRTNTFNDIGRTNFRPANVAAGFPGVLPAPGARQSWVIPVACCVLVRERQRLPPFRPNGHGGEPKTPGNTPRAHCRTPRGHVQDPGAKSMTLRRCHNSRFDEPSMSDSLGMDAPARERAVTASRRRR